MDWLPNEEAVRWLLQNVWPKVNALRPEARLHLAGNQMPKDLKSERRNGVTCRGRVKDAYEYMRARDVMVVPLFSAGGMRVKIIEGMALGKAIISTPIGAEGIAYTEGKDILIARTAKEFTEHMTALMDAPERVTELGRHARALVKRSYSDKRIVADLVAFYKRLGKA
ncbi:MAG: glycosyltransferase, partial [Flavobacteriales bacterium]|nr:glycosyltransferase [Flavobacteriales bacterium]